MITRAILASTLAAVVRAAGEEKPDSGPGHWSRNDKILIAHAVFGTLAIVLLTPTALLIARIGRGKRWFAGHATLNGLFVVFIIIAFALGVTVVEGEFGQDFHHSLGLALFVLVLVQSILGIIGHFWARPSPLTSAAPSWGLPRPNPIRILHILLGLTIVGLGYTQVINGMYIEWPKKSDAGTATPFGVKVVFWILFALFIATYGTTWIVQAIRGRGREGRTSLSSAASSNNALVGTPKTGGPHEMATTNV
ncbi:proteophosphoglycan ppg4 [Rhodotorula toruloides]|uniref:Proteophosphoglycan ppg4 n=1 Tax=Rhodotorula toruloides TaxID=5286 RepID=A0A511KCX5_RHOTO|nr:proteophosphoglycan ppg4 [Rhodotorula toruloides]